MAKNVFFNKKTTRFFLVTALVLSFFFPLAASLTSVFSGSIAFWYDPARDLLLALQNLSKPTLIGPTSGIPGFFYGPYWIWLLSFAMLFSKDPRIIAFITETIPYFTVFPLLLFVFRRIFNIKILIILWLLFILNFNSYTVQLWNPNLAPLFFLSVITLVTFINYAQRNTKNYALTVLLGFMTGLTLHFHISFGLCLALAVFLFLLTDAIFAGANDKKTRWKNIFQRAGVIFLFFFGFLVTFLPFFAFEYRHGFMQTQTAIKTIISPVAVVSQIGLSKQDIVLEFFGRLGETFMLPSMVITILSIAGFVFLLVTGLRKIDLSQQETRLLVFLSFISIAVLLIYLSAKNPVWHYHFIGVELIFLFILALLLKKFSFLEKILVVYVSIIFVVHAVSFMSSFKSDPVKLNSLAAEEHIVRTITADSQSGRYTVFAYNPAIYSYEYAYLFQMRGVVVPYDPGMIAQGAQNVYLILPVASEQIKNDFIEFRTPKKSYITAKTWSTPNGSTIIKREKK